MLISMMPQYDLIDENDRIELSDSMDEYNLYIENHIKTLFEFDVWFEYTKNKEFPKEWYTVIRNSCVDK